jgi:G3E family GTPase
MELNTEERAKVLSRIKKLLTLANNSAASEGERDNAMRMAHNTLAKYNLTLSEAESAGNVTQEQRLVEGMKTVGYPWTRHVAMGIAELFFCDTFYVRTSPRYHVIYFVGRASNVFTAKAMLQYLYDSITREAVKKSKEQFNVGEGAYQRNFAKGAARTIYHRCAQLRKEAEQASKQAVASTSTALVLASVYAQEEAANAEFMKQNKIDIKETESRESAPGTGFREGIEHGRSVSLNRQIGGGDEVKKLK